MRLVRHSFKQLFLHPFIINASVTIDYRGEILHTNWGDDINYFFLREIISRPFIFLSEAPLSKILRQSDYMVIGSIIGMFSDNRSIIWGAGIMDGGIKNIPIPRKICAVRGPLTRQKMLDMGIDCPEVYGDPALLIAKHYKPDVSICHKIGIVAHYTETHVVDAVRNICSDVHVIDIANYADWHDFIDQLLSCEALLSSSLHGLIMSEAYGIPGIWIEFAKTARRDRFKYYDFYASIGKPDEQPLIISSSTTATEVENKLNNWRPGHMDLNPLIEACPFPIKL